MTDVQTLNDLRAAELKQNQLEQRLLDLLDRLRAAEERLRAAGL